MSESDSQNRYAPPQAVVTDGPTAGSSLHLADRGDRLFAVIVDGVFVMVLAFITMFTLGISMSDVFMSRHVTWHVYMGFLPAWILSLVVQAWFLYTRSQTIGKIALKIRVVRADGSRVSFPRLFFGRLLCMALLGMIPFLGRLIGLVDALLIFRESRMCLHDQIFDTRVVTAASSENATLAGLGGPGAGAPATP
jgi:uncharacterized RDD family membrane protein YckC